MGGRGGSSGLLSDYGKTIGNSLPNELDFKFRDLPDLQGSPKQIGWAEKIRSRVINDLKSYATGHQSDGSMAIDNVIGKTKREMIQKVKQRIDGAISNEAKEYQKNYAIERYKDISERIKRVNEVASVKSASWWIDYSQKYETKFGQSGNYKNQQFKKFVDGKLKLKNRFQNNVKMWVNSHIFYFV